MSESQASYMPAVYVVGQRIRVLAQVLVYQEDATGAKMPWVKLRVPAWGGHIHVYRLAERFREPLQKAAASGDQIPMMLVCGKPRKQPPTSGLNYSWWMASVGNAALETPEREPAQEPGYPPADSTSEILTVLRSMDDKLARILLAIVDKDDPAIFLPPSPQEVPQTLQIASIKRGIRLDNISGI